MKLHLSLTTAAALALALCACSDPDDRADSNINARPSDVATDPGAGASAPATAVATDAMPANAQGFVDAAAASDMFELESSRLAQAKAKDQAVKGFSQMMIDDHTKSSTELSNAAAKATPPATVAPKLTAEQQANLDKLRAATTDFDKQYARMQVMAHEKALALMQSYAAGGDSQPLKDFASRTAPIINEHLTRAKSLPQD